MNNTENEKQEKERWWRCRYAMNVDKIHSYYTKTRDKKKFSSIHHTIFRKIISEINKAYVQQLLTDGFVDLPAKFGALYIEKDSEKTRGNISWVKTKELWKEDEWAEDNNIRLHYDNPMCRIKFDANPKELVNSEFIKFSASGELMNKIYSSF